MHSKLGGSFTVPEKFLQKNATELAKVTEKAEKIAESKSESKREMSNKAAATTEQAMAKHVFPAKVRRRRVQVWSLESGPISLESGPVSLICPASLTSGRPPSWPRLAQVWPGPAPVWPGLAQIRTGLSRTLGAVSLLTWPLGLLASLAHQLARTKARSSR